MGGHVLLESLLGPLYLPVSDVPAQDPELLELRQQREEMELFEKFKQQLAEQEN